MLNRLSATLQWWIAGLTQVLLYILTVAIFMFSALLLVDGFTDFAVTFALLRAFRWVCELF